MPCRLLRPRVAAWACLVAGLTGAALAGGHADPPPAPVAAVSAAGYLISVDADGHVQVAPKTPEEVEKAPPAKGLLVWGEDELVERWKAVGPGWKQPPPLALAEAPAGPGDPTRGTAPAAGGVEMAQLTLQLPPIDLNAVTRALKSLLTPPDQGGTFTGKPTFRRTEGTDEKKPSFPAEDVELRPQRDGGPKLTVHFAEGQKSVAFTDLKNVPKEYANGLPPGRYQYQREQGGGSFTVEDADVRQKVLGRADELAALLGNRRDPLYLQFALEALLAKSGINPKGTNYLGDALDLLESVPEKELTPSLEAQRKQLPKVLESAGALDPKPSGGETGKDDIDNARALVAANQWREALQALDKPASSPDRHVAGRAQLYRGAILAESGAARAAEAQEAFRQALEALKDADAADRYRAHINYGNFLMRTAQDRLHNQALQAAAGVPQPVLNALHDWLDARRQYEAAVDLTPKLEKPARQKAAALVNLARLYALLADLITTIDIDEGGRRDFPEGGRAAWNDADRLAKEAADNKEADAPTRAVAEEVRALRALRANDGAATKEAVRRALAAHLDAGNLAGAESAYRTLGLVAAAANTPAGREEALRDLRVASLITESLRERFPPDRTGLTTAGFFARKAYVSQKIVELRLAQGKLVEALTHAEQAKARSLQDMLAAGRDQQENRPGPRRRAPEKRDLGVVLRDWPHDAAAVEYFFGTDEAFVFVVNPRGQVSAHKLVGPGDKPVAPRDLITRVRKVLANMEGHGRKMAVRLQAKGDFDNGWQDELHALYQVLLPAEARKELEGAAVLVIVPQHILHYFPFAALVAEKDAAAMPARVARPRFLIEEGGRDIVYAPSLTAWRPKDPPGVAGQVSVVGLVEAPGAPVLKGVKKDLENLKEVFGPRVRPENFLEGDAATEAGAKKLLGQGGMMFFATHGLNEPDRPLESHLLLLADEQPAAHPDSNDGRLTAAELYALDVKAELVVMSCCYSGLGDRSPLPGDDLFGLQRAFLQSGARAVVSGQWDVYDRTAPVLMRSFFEKLAAGRGAAAALGGSQRDFLEKLRAAPQMQPWLYHPYYWAVYTVAGDDRTGVGK